MAKDVNKLPNAREAVIPDSTLSYLRGISPQLAESFDGILNAKASLSLLSMNGQKTPDYMSYLRAVHHHAKETKAPLAGRDFIIAPNLPVPNVLTTLYDQLKVPTWRQRHARAIGNTGLSGMQLMIDFEGVGRNDTVSLGYLRPGAETAHPDAHLAFFDDSDVILLQGGGLLKGVTDISASPEMKEAVTRDVIFAARHILGLHEA